MPAKKFAARELFFMQDLAIIFLSVLIAVILVYSGALSRLLAATQGLGFLGSFLSGMFFTSVFTTAPAIATLAELSRLQSLAGNALFGALGAVMGDLLIFRFVRDRFSEHLRELLSHGTGKKRFKALFRLRSFRYLTFFVGGLIIASPLPDEIGISLLGFSKMKQAWFIPLSFVFNFLGILGIGYLARALI